MTSKSVALPKSFFTFAHNFHLHVGAKCSHCNVQLTVVKESSFASQTGLGRKKTVDCSKEIISIWIYSSQYQSIKLFLNQYLIPILGIGLGHLYFKGNMGHFQILYIHFKSYGHQSAMITCYCSLSKISDTEWQQLTTYLNTSSFWLTSHAVLLILISKLFKFNFSSRVLIWSWCV